MDNNNNQEQKPKGMPGKRKSNYGLQLQEKQKVKGIYGMREKQFRRFFNLASKEKGDKGAKLVELLERRLDNVIFRLGWAKTRRMARQMVSHRHFKVNGRVMNIPSYIVKPEDEIEYRVDKMKKTLANIEDFTPPTPPNWLEKSSKGAKVKGLPVRKDLDVPIKESLIVELYSK